MDVLAVTASLIWAFKAGAPADAAPLVAGERVFYAVADKKLYGLAAADGRKLWARRFGSPLPLAPVTDGPLIFQFVPSPEGRVYALRADTGAKVWRADAGPGVTVPAAAAGVVAVGRRNSLTYLDAAHGLTRGAVDLGAPVAGVVAVPDGTFVAWTSTGTVARCAPRADAPLWSRVVAATGVYVSTAGDAVWVAGRSGVLVSLALASGEEMWRRELGEPLVGPAAAAGDALVVTGRRTVYVTAQSSGETRWAYAADANVKGAAPFRDGVVIGYEDGRVVYAAASGATEIARAAEYGAAAPAVAGDRLFVGDGVKRLNCYRLR